MNLESPTDPDSTIAFLGETQKKVEIIVEFSSIAVQILPQVFDTIIATLGKYASDFKIDDYGRYHGKCTAFFNSENPIPNKKHPLDMKLTTKDGRYGEDCTLLIEKSNGEKKWVLGYSLLERHIVFKTETQQFYHVAESPLVLKPDLMKQSDQKDREAGESNRE
uniref:AlNc14C106G6228 protein n=1 Tax=Albugo laibachii Nc14 TaxID=890382 RepID=F0WI21_9STRA|nr:AlNc14C106G6228 [Albugo laibachii Nc14]|eukprot:CCA20898.1 AlNc14C106G6228 [Albugo laibachii Nc14]